LKGTFQSAYHFGAYDYTSYTYAPFTLGVRANVQTKPSIPIGAKAEINRPQVLINAELYDLALATRLEKGYHQIWEANLQPLGAILCSSIYLLIS
jgi:hypothetical protein